MSYILVYSSEIKIHSFIHSMVMQTNRTMYTSSVFRGAYRI